MEIRIVFANTFHNMMRAKLRWFFRRSLYRYAFAVALITYSIHGGNPRLTTTDVIVRGFGYFAALCLAVLVLHTVLALIQSRRIIPRTITFTEQNLSMERNGKLVTQSWNWIISAKESPTLISLLVQKMPRLELYVAKDMLTENEYTVFRNLLSSNGKLPPLVESVKQTDVQLSGD
ncbi:MAG: hypothetical protein KDB03_12625 [Planctomycetales bacterium]|nr:hypothetical protein [Planctomycetales bacterium]